MSSDFQKATLGKLVNFSNGRSSPERFEDGKFAVFGSNGLIGRANETNAPSNSIVIGRVGSYCGSVHFSQKSCWVTDNAIKAEAKDNNNPEFLFYLLKHLNLNNWRSGSGQPLINQTTLNAIEVRVPEPEEQKEIGQFISSLDNRISLLRETNTTLEAIAQALFKSWFVDFDPVRAKQQGNAPQGMAATTAALFPDSFEESELGEVPKGWRVGSIDDLCDVISNGGTPSRSKSEYWTNGTMPWFKTGDFSDGFLLTPVERINDEAIVKSSVKVLPRNAILMAIYAAPTVGRLGILTESATFNQACTGMVAKKSVGPWFLYLTLFFGRIWFNSRANGAAQQNISKAIVSSYKIVIPSPEVLAEFHKLSESLYNRIRECSQQVQTLTTLRDTLLPRLISGQLRLSTLEEAD